MTIIVILLGIYLIYHEYLKEHIVVGSRYCATIPYESDHKETRTPEEILFIQQCKELDEMIENLVRESYPGFRKWEYIRKDMTGIVSSTKPVIKRISILPRRGEAEIRKIRVTKESEIFHVDFIAEYEESPDNDPVNTPVNPVPVPVSEENFDIGIWYSENQAMLKALTPPGTKEAVIPMSKLPQSETNRRLLERDFYVLGYKNARLTKEGLVFEK